MRGSNWLHRLRINTRGQDLIEYALMAGFIAVVIGATVPTRIVPSMGKIYEAVDTMLKVWAK